jgi:hypothetical protein
VYCERHTVTSASTRTGRSKPDTRTGRSMRLCVCGYIPQTRDACNPENGVVTGRQPPRHPRTVTNRF